MASTPIRDQLGDHLITPQNSALLVIDYQPSQIDAVRSIDHELLLKNVISTVKVANLFELPIVHSTITSPTGMGPPCRGSRRSSPPTRRSTAPRSTRERTLSSLRPCAEPGGLSC